MRGENSRPSPSAKESVGSSPHARGKLRCPAVIVSPSGLIPACAGKTCRPARRTRRRGAHPRMRGENIIHTPIRRQATGSSPHARGKLYRKVYGEFVSRLIPACAGKTKVSSLAASIKGAHPRMRGENTDLSRKVVLNLGSSPHARGKQLSDKTTVQAAGLIPACAGKTRPTNGTFFWFQAHPRMRGENFRAQNCFADETGSSPHARGKRCL